MRKFEMIKDRLAVIDDGNDRNSAELHPDRYCTGKYECWEVMEEIIKKKNMNAFQGYLFGCAFKYLWRLGEKDIPEKEIDKAINYLNKLKESYKG